MSRVWLTVALLFTVTKSVGSVIGAILFPLWTWIYFYPNFSKFVYFYGLFYFAAYMIYLYVRVKKIILYRDEEKNKLVNKILEEAAKKGKRLEIMGRYRNLENLSFNVLKKIYSELKKESDDE